MLPLKSYVPLKSDEVGEGEQKLISLCVVMGLFLAEFPVGRTTESVCYLASGTHSQLSREHREGTPLPSTHTKKTGMLPLECQAKQDIIFTLINVRSESVLTKFYH